MIKNRNIYHFNIIGESPKGGYRRKKGYNPRIGQTIPKKEKLLTRQEAAEYLNISVSTLDNYVRGSLISRVKIGPRMVRFTLDDLDRFIEGNNRKRT